MRKILLVAVAVAMLTVGIAGIAVAKTFVCQAVPCEGTNNPDQIGERNGSVRDVIRANGGDDVVNADRASMDADRVSGKEGDDVLDVGDGDFRDVVSGGDGFDTCIVDVSETANFFDIDGLNSCEDALASDESMGGARSSSTTTEGLRPLTAEELAAAEANYR
jgi:Ca2+-binding RTX toxin-like protein